MFGRHAVEWGLSTPSSLKVMGHDISEHKKNKNTGNKNKNVQVKNTSLPIAVGSEGLPVTHGTTRRNGGGGGGGCVQT